MPGTAAGVAVTAPSDGRDYVQRQFLLAPDDAEWVRTFAFMRRSSQAQVMRDALDRLIDEFNGDPEDRPSDDKVPDAKPKNFEVTRDQAEWLYQQAHVRRTSQAKLAREAILRMRTHYG